MAIPLKQSTASQEVLLGPFLDDTDGKTAETGLTIANTDIKIWKAGGTSEASKNSGGATHIASGRYYAVLDATDTDTLGAMEINVHVAGALPVRRECLVLPANVFDALIAGSDALQVHTNEITNDLITAAAIAAGAIDRATFAADTGLQSIRSNTAQAGAAMTITLDASASATDDFYNGALLAITGGTGAGQPRTITDYVGSTKVATVDEAWVTNPDNTSTFAVLAGATAPTAVQIATTLLLSSLAADGTAGGRTVQDALRLLRNKVAISGGTMTVCEEDDTTSAWTAAITTAAGNPVVSSDPA